MTKLAFIMFGLTLIAAPLAAADSVQEPLLGKVEEKTEQAARDPTGYAANQSSPDQMQQDARWGVAYACFALDWAGDEANVNPPNLEPCEGYEDVIRGRPAPPPSPPGPIVEPFEPDAVDETEMLVDDTVTMVDEIADNPPSAPQRLVAFIGHAVDFLLSLLRSLADGVGAALGAVGSGIRATAAGIVQGIGAAVDGVVERVGSVIRASAAAVHSLGSGIGAAVEAAGDAGRAAGAKIGEAASNLSDWVGSLWSDESPRPAMPDDVAGIGADGKDGPVGDVICLDCLLESAPTVGGAS